MDNLLKFPWGMVLSNFVWILGASVILATFSYHEFLAHAEGVKRKEIFKRRSFVKTFLIGSVLVGTGVSLSLHEVVWKVVFGVITIGMILLLIRRRRI